MFGAFLHGDGQGESAASVYSDRTDPTRFEVTEHFKTIKCSWTNAAEWLNGIQNNTSGHCYHE